MEQNKSSTTGTEHTLTTSHKIGGEFKKEKNSPFIEERLKKWEELYNTAKKQTLTGIAFAAVERLPQEHDRMPSCTGLVNTKRPVFIASGDVGISCPVYRFKIRMCRILNIGKLI